MQAGGRRSLLLPCLSPCNAGRRNDSLEWSNCQSTEVQCAKRSHTWVQDIFRIGESPLSLISSLCPCRKLVKFSHSLLFHVFFLECGKIRVPTWMGRGNSIRLKPKCYDPVQSPQWGWGLKVSKQMFLTFHLPLHPATAPSEVLIQVRSETVSWGHSATNLIPNSNKKMVC